MQGGIMPWCAKWRFALPGTTIPPALAECGPVGQAVVQPPGCGGGADVHAPSCGPGASVQPPCGCCGPGAAHPPWEGGAVVQPAAGCWAVLPGPWGL